MEEAFFVPCNRMPDLLLARDDVCSYPEAIDEAVDEMLIGKTQVGLQAGLSIEDILPYANDSHSWVNLWSLVGCTSFVWMGPDTVIGVDPPGGNCRDLLAMLGYEEVLVIEVPNRQPSWVQSSSPEIRAAAVCDPLLRLLTEPYYSARYLTLTFQSGQPVSSLALSELLVRCEQHSGIVFGKRCILTNEYLRMIQTDCGFPTQEINLFAPPRNRTMALDFYLESLSGVDPEIVTDSLRKYPWTILLRCGSIGIRRFVQHPGWKNEYQAALPLLRNRGRVLVS